MRLAIVAFAAAVAVAAPALAKNDKGQGNGGPPAHAQGNRGGDDDTPLFNIGGRDRDLLRSYFAAAGCNPEALPPGIRKNLARGKPLPPGIAKKCTAGDDIRRQLSQPDYEYVLTGRDVYVLDPVTQLIVDVIIGVLD